MLSYIYDPVQILAAQTAFENRFRSVAASIEMVNVGYQGGSLELQVA